MTADDGLRVVLVTAPDEPTGRDLARKLVAEGVAACVNVVAGVTSVYRWQGAVEEDAEVLLVVKSSAACRARLEACLAREHPYDVPECVWMAPAEVEEKYGAWWNGELREGT